MKGVDISALSPAAQRVLAPGTPPKLVELAARGVLPGARPADVVAVLLVLSANERPEVASTAKATIAALPEPVLAGVIAANDLGEASIDAIARAYPTRIDVLQRLLAMPAIAMETVEEIARSANEAVAELIATNEDRLRHHPRLVELLYLNKHTRMSTADRIVELAVRHNLDLSGIPAWEEAREAIKNELVSEQTEEPTPGDLLFMEVDAIAKAVELAEDEDAFVETDDGDEVPQEKCKTLLQKMAAMTVTEKVRRATLGTKADRAVLIRDRNKLVARAVARSPMLQLAEVENITKNRNISEEVLNILGKSPTWARSYTVKLNLAQNPKTPLSLAVTLVNQLREADLRSLAKSKNVTGPVRDAARRHLGRRKT